MNLYSLTGNLMRVIEGGMVVDEESGEILFDSDDLEELELAYTEKLEGCGIYAKNLQAEIDALKKEESNLSARRRMKESKLNRLKEYMLQSMEATETSKLETPKVAISTRKSQLVIVDDEERVPLQFVKVTKSVNNTELKKALKAGEVEGAHIEESINLQLK